MCMFDLNFLAACMEIARHSCTVEYSVIGNNIGARKPICDFLKLVFSTAIFEIHPLQSGIVQSLLKKLLDKTRRISERCSLEYGCCLSIPFKADSAMRLVAIPVVSISLMQLFWGFTGSTCLLVKQGWSVVMLWSIGFGDRSLFREY